MTTSLKNTAATEYEYDDAGRRTAVINALSQSHHYAYDDNGNLISETDANGHRTEYEYNDLDQKVLTRFHNGSTMEDEFDAMGRKTASIDQAGTRTEYGYDSLGRLTEVRQFLNGTAATQTLTTSYTYDSQGNKLTQTDAEDKTTHWTYDSMGRVLSRTLPMGQRETFTYDVHGNQTSQTDFNGQITVNEYDPLNRLTTKTYADGIVETWAYDAAGRIIQTRQTIDGNAEITTYAYDARDRLTREVQPSGSQIDYGYDEAGNRTTLTTTVNGASRTVNYTFDVLNRLATVTDLNGTTTYAYDAAGNRSSVTQANKVTTRYTYDSLNRLTELQSENSSDVVLTRFAYTLGATGRRTNIEELSGRVTDYVYDDLYRLTGEQITDAQNGNYSASYQYDQVGNRTYSTIDGVQTAFSYDDNDRLTQQGGTTYNYDANGNTLSESEDGQATTYTYDARNKMVASTSANGTATYAYDINGIRTGKTEGGVTTRYLVDHNQQYAQVLSETQNNVTTKQYTYGDDLLSQTLTNTNENSFYLYDGLGSTRALTNASGNLSDAYAYDAFGQTLSESGSTDNNYLFTGEQFDQTLDKLYLRARYYDQGVGRFTQQDTWLGNNSDPVTLHKYLYANADPVNHTDPTGNFSLLELNVAQNIASVMMDMQVQASMSILDGALGIIPGGEEMQSSVRQAQMLIGIAQLGAGGVQIMRLLSGKFRKLCNSFDGDTLVHTESGLKKIKDIRIGESVWAYDEETGEKSLQEVTHLIQSEGDKDIVDIELASGEVIQATDGHPFYVPESGEVWVEASALDTDMLLYSIAGESVGLADVGRRQNYQQVYNLTVDQDHTYYVGSAGVLNHNASKKCGLPIVKGWEAPDSSALRAAMKAKGIKPPPYPNAAHHIVAGTDSRAHAARQHLSNLGIKANDSANGVFLKYTSKGCGANHCEIHTDTYYGTVNRMLLGQKTREGVNRVLKKIADGLQDGSFVY